MMFSKVNGPRLDQLKLLSLNQRKGCPGRYWTWLKFLIQQVQERLGTKVLEG